MLLIRRVLWQWRPSKSASATVTTILRRYHRPSTATVRCPSNLTDDRVWLRALTPLTVSQLPCTPHHGLLLLATPVLAPALFNDRRWLISFLDQLYAAVPKLDLSLRVGVAVVDALPAPKQPCYEDCFHSPNTLSPSSGINGLAYLFSDSSLFKSYSPVRPSGNNPATVSLALHHPLRRGSDAYEVDVPLANTTFVVGRDAVSMIIDFKKSGEQPFRETSSVDTQNITVSWPFSILDGGPHDGSLALSAPLLPLTVPRKILAGMGNVVRRISGSKTDASGIPASSELEAAVTSFFQTTGLPPSSISAWALVAPPEIHELPAANGPLQSHASPESLQALWKSSASVPDEDFLPLLRRGARLHRVLSGGGGWGQKAGLLALDPFTNFVGDESGQPSRFQNDPDAASYGEAMLGDAARVGDYIQFFISRTEETKVEPDAGYKPSRLWSLQVGTIPSTIDQVPTKSRPSEQDESDHTAYFPHHFGALSEKGLSIRLSHVEPQTKQITPSNCSKFDVPFSLLAAKRLSFGFGANSKKRLSSTNRPYKVLRQAAAPVSRERQIRNLNFLTERAEQQVMFYATCVVNALQCQNSEAGSKFSQFLKLAEIWCDRKLSDPIHKHWRNKWREGLWEMINSAMELELMPRRFSRTLHGLEWQVLASERSITRLKASLSNILHAERKPKPTSVFRMIRSKSALAEPSSAIAMLHAETKLKSGKVFRRIRSKPALAEPSFAIKKYRSIKFPSIRRTSSSKRATESGVNQDASADQAWDLLSKRSQQLAKRNGQSGHRQTLAEENRVLADQIAKLLDGFQP